MTLAVGYVRCSTDEQGSTSIPQQKEEIQKWIVGKDYEIFDWFVDEGKSGTSFTKRPAFNRLVSAVEGKPAFKHVLVYDESRWGRSINLRESNYWKTHFEMHGVKVRIINSSSKQENDIGSLVTEAVESAESSEFSKKLSRSVRRGMLSSQQGKYSRGGTAPYGYKRVAVNLQTGEQRELCPGSWVIPKAEKAVWELGDPNEVSTVQRIFDLKVSGLGYVAIADTLNGEGIPCPKRGRWRNRDQRWSGGTIISILQNRTYLGERIYNRLSFSKFKAIENGVTDFARFTDRPKFHNDKSEWKIIPSAHPAIVTEEIFLKANIKTRMLNYAGGEPQNQHFYRSQYLLTGLIKCAHCHFNYQGYKHKKTGHKYYVDGGFINKGKSVCSYHSVRQDRLEAFVLESIRETLLAPAMIEKIEDELRELLNDQSSSLKEDRKTEVEGQIREIQNKVANLISLAENGTVLDSITDRIRQLEETKRKLEVERDKIQQTVNPPQEIVKNITGAVRSFLENFEEKLKSVSTFEKKELIRMVVDKIVVDKEADQIQCYLRGLPAIDEIEKYKGDNSLLSGVAPTGIEPVF